MDERYQIQESIGQGANGIVYKAYDRHLQQFVAIKHLAKQEQWALEEAEILKKLKHPSIPIVYDVLKYNEELYLVMEYMEGKNLLCILEERGMFPEEQAVKIALAVGESLFYLHHLPEKIIYRDLKPANLIIDDLYQVKLVDFDSAFFAGKRGAKETCVAKDNYIGTYGYSAPEQFVKGETVDEKSDIYAFGMTLYHMLTGKNPSRPPYYLHKIRECNPLFLESLEAIVEKCIAKDRTKRYDNMEQVLADLRSYKEKKKEKKIRFRFWIRRRRRYVVEGKKSIFLTAKKMGGLFLLLFFLGSVAMRFWPAGIVNAAPTDVLPLVLYNDNREKIIVKDGCFYEGAGDFHMEVPKFVLNEHREVEITVICKDLQTGEKLEKVVLIRGK